MAKTKKETRKKPPAHEVIVRGIEDGIKSARRAFPYGTDFHFLVISPLMYALLVMHIPEQARRKTAERVYNALLVFRRLGVRASDIRNIYGSDSRGVRARIRSGR